MWTSYLFYNPLFSPLLLFACDNITSTIIWDQWALWTGTVVIALHGASQWQRAMQRQVDDSSITTLMIPSLSSSAPTFHSIAVVIVPIHSLFSSKHPTSLLCCLLLTSLLLTHPRPPAVCPHPSPWAPTHLSGTTSPQEGWDNKNS